MLKFMNKIFLVSVLSGSLMLMDFSMQSAFAQQASIPILDPKVQEAHDQFIKQTQQSKGQSQDTTGMRTETLKTGVKSETDIMATLSMSAVGTLASRLYKYKMTTDIMLAAAGGALFIGGEIASFASLDSALKEIESQITRDKNGNINKEQIRHLERLKQSYEEAKKTAGTKKTLQLAAAAAFAAAGVMAAMMTTAEMTALTACQTGVKAALTTLKSQAATCAAMTVGAAACLAPVKACTGAVTSYHSSIVANELSRQAITPSAPGFSSFTSSGAAAEAQLKGLSGLCTAQTSAVNATLQPTCSPLIPLEMTDASFVATPTALLAGNPLPSTLKKYFSSAKTKETIQVFSKTNNFERTLNVFIPQADAALFSAMGIMSSAAVTYVLATSATLAVELDFFMLIPKNRMYVWAGLAATTALATKATDSTIAKIQSNIDKIDVILNEMATLGERVETAQTPASNTPGSVNNYKPTSITPGQIKYSDIDLSNTAKGNLALPCYTGPDSAPCKSFQTTFKDSKGYNNLNGQSQLELGNIFKIADGVNGTSMIGKATLEGAASLAGSANALRASLDKSQKTALEKLKNSGAKDDSALLSKKFSDAMEKSVNAGLKKSNSTAEGIFAGMYGGGSTTAATADTSSSKKTEVETVKTSLQSGGGPDVINLNTGSSEAVDLGLGLGKGTEVDSNAVDLAAVNSASKSTSMDDFILKNDITKDAESSIFDLISSRYQKSGYPRLLKLKEPQTVPAKN
jgi:hypothetical protein